MPVKEERAPREDSALWLRVWKHVFVHNFLLRRCCSVDVQWDSVRPSSCAAEHHIPYAHKATIDERVFSI